MQVRPVSQLVPRELAWLWPGRLALGKLAMLEGDPGLGKSLVALDLCARLSTGRPLPDGSPGPSVCNALVLNAEDGDEDIVRLRLHALGADLERVFVMQLKGEGPLRLPGQTDLLDEALAQTGARLVVIDPIVAFLEPSVHVSSDPSVRRALFPLARLADRYQCVIWLIRHLNKRLGGRSVYRGGGSIGFLGACRSGWLVATDPQAPQRRALAQVKNNLAPPQPSLAYTVTYPASAGGEGSTAKPIPAPLPELQWLGPSPWTADDLLMAAAPETAWPRPRDHARDFLSAFLEDGPRTSRELWAAAQEEGLAERTLFRAKRELEIRSLRVSVEGKVLTYWLLPDQQLPDSVPPEAVPPDLEPWLAPLREQFPLPTPLDEM